MRATYDNITAARAGEDMVRDNGRVNRIAGLELEQEGLIDVLQQSKFLKSECENQGACRALTLVQVTEFQKKRASVSPAESVMVPAAELCDVPGVAMIRFKN